MNTMNLPAPYPPRDCLQQYFLLKIDMGMGTQIPWKKIVKVEKICMVGQKVASQIFSGYVPQFFSWPPPVLYQNIVFYPRIWA